MKRDNYIHYRVSNIEKRAIEFLADLERRPVSEMQRELLREGMRSRGITIMDILKIMKEESEAEAKDFAAGESGSERELR